MNVQTANDFRTILITGASRGIGLEMTKQLLQLDKMDVIFATIRSKSSGLELLKQKYKKLQIVEMDVANQDSIKNAFDSINKQCTSIDLIVNNAGILGIPQEKIYNKPTEIDGNELMEAFQTNVVGVMNVTNTFFPLFNNSKKTLVINISSDSGSISQNYFAKIVPYRVSKCALNMLTKAYSVELGDRATFILVHPGWLKTEMGNSGVEEAPLEVDYGVNKVISLIYTVRENKNGHFLDLNGDEIKW